MGNHLISDLVAFQGIGIICIVHSLFQIVHNNRIGERVKRASVWACVLAGLVIFCQWLYFIALDLFPNSIVLTVIASMKYIILSFFPVVVLSALEKDTYIHSLSNAFLVIIMGGYYMSLVLNYFQPIFFTLDEHGCFTKEPFFFVHSIVMFIIYTIAFIMLFKKKYTISVQEVAAIIALIAIFIFAIFCTDVDFHPGVLEALCGVAVMILTFMFQALEAKICPVTTLPYLNILLSDKKKLNSKKRKIIYIFTVDGLKAYNEEYGKKAGDKYFYAVAKTIADSFKHSGSSYRCTGNTILLFANDSERFSNDLIEFMGNTHTDKQYGDYRMNIDVCSMVYDKNTIIKDLKKYV